MRGVIELQRVDADYWCWSIVLYPAGHGVLTLDLLESFATATEARRSAEAWAEPRGITVVDPGGGGEGHAA